jgi:hypothetical protein
MLKYLNKTRPFVGGALCDVGRNVGRFVGRRGDVVGMAPDAIGKIDLKSISFVVF